MKRIKLTRGKFTLVDDNDFKYLNKWKWYCSSRGYAMRDIKAEGEKRMAILMHRLITNAPTGTVIDHINGDKLDNRRNNLMVVTQHENGVNRKVLNKNNTSGYRGVSWFPQRNKWVAKIMVNYRNKHLGIFSNIEKAILIRKEAEEKYFPYLSRIGVNHV